MTGSSANWTDRHGGYDALDWESCIWPSHRPLGTPSLQPQSFNCPLDFRLLPYRSRDEGGVSPPRF